MSNKNLLIDHTILQVMSESTSRDAVDDIHYIVNERLTNNIHVPYDRKQIRDALKRLRKAGKVKKHGIYPFVSWHLVYDTDANDTVTQEEFALRLFRAETLSNVLGLPLSHIQVSYHHHGHLVFSDEAVAILAHKLGIDVEYTYRKE